MHPFGIYSEGGASGVHSPEMAALFAPDVVLHSPFLIKSVQGKELTIHFLAEAFELVGYPKYMKELKDGQHTTALLWRGNVQGHEIQGTMVITEGEDGLIHELRSYLRPFQVVALLRNSLLPSASSTLPREYWEVSPLGIPSADLAPKLHEQEQAKPKAYKELPFQGKRIRFDTTRSYDEVLQNLYELVETRNLKDAQKQGMSVIPQDFAKLVQTDVTPENFEKVFKSHISGRDFMLFFEFDQGIWLPAFGIKRKVTRWVMGNPFIAITMMKHDIQAGLFTPVELLLFENETGDGSTVIYDLPSAQIVIDKNPVVLEAARILDQKLYAVVSGATGVEAD